MKMKCVSNKQTIKRFFGLFKKTIEHPFTVGEVYYVEGIDQRDFVTGQYLNTVLYVYMDNKYYELEVDLNDYYSMFERID